MTYQNIQVEVRGKVGIVVLSRPDRLNALSNALMKELEDALNELETSKTIGAIVITGSKKAFAAGADIDAMRNWGFSDVYKANYVTENWERIKTCRKPVIAAVAGYALGGGCELAMMCDMILASETAIFGQPEIKVGVIPGAGGTQRLPRAIGKAKAMDMCLTGRVLGAIEAERAGLISRVVPSESLVEEAIAIAQKIAEFSSPVAMMIKESINRAYESSLAEGVLFERRMCHAAFALEDRKEGMYAFVERRRPSFVDR